MEVIAYTMEYVGPLIESESALTPFQEKYYEIYRDIYHDCFYEMRMALGLKPYNACDSIDKLLSKKDDIFLLFVNDEIVASVSVYKNEIDDLFVAKNFQRQGYGKNCFNLLLAYCKKETYPQ